MAIHFDLTLSDRHAQLLAAARWMALAGFNRVTHANVITTLGRPDGLLWFVGGLARLEPVVYVPHDVCAVCRGSGHAPPTTNNGGASVGYSALWYGGTECLSCGGERYTMSVADQRARVMQAAISSVLACLRHPIAQLGPEALADLLLDHGHAWLGEPLAVWLVGEREQAVSMLVDRMPVLPEFAEWAREDASRLSLQVRVDGAEAQTVTFNSTGFGETTRAIADAMNAQLVGVTAQVERNDTITLTTATGTISSVQVETTARARGSARHVAVSPWQERASTRRSRWR